MSDKVGHLPPPHTLSKAWEAMGAFQGDNRKASWETSSGAMLFSYPQLRNQTSKPAKLTANILAHT